MKLAWNTVLPLAYVFAGVLFTILGVQFAQRTQTTTLYCKDGRFKQFLLKNVTTVQETYLAPIYGFSGYVHSVLAILYRQIATPMVEYDREILTMKDGGEVAIDWRFPNSDGPQKLFTVIILSGITGDSQAEYIRETVLELFKNGYCCVVFNYRGRGGVKLKSARTYSANNIEDLTEVVKHIKYKRPNNPIVGIGFSMGGTMLGSFLMSQEQADNKHLVTGILISVPWNVPKACINSESTWLMRKMNQYLSYHLSNVIVENKDIVFNQDNNNLLDYNSIKECTTIREFDSAYTVKMFNYKDIHHYYEDASLSNKLHLMNVPCLSLSAADDPFLYLNDIPTKEANQSSKVAIIVTSGGGHVGFLNMFWPLSKANYMLKLIQEYFDAIMLDNIYEKLVEF